MHRLDTWFTNIHTAFFIHYINIEMIINWILKFKQFIPNLFKTSTSSYLSLSRMIKKIYKHIHIHILYQMYVHFCFNAQKIFSMNSDKSDSLSKVFVTYFKCGRSWRLLVFYFTNNVNFNWVNNMKQQTKHAHSSN